MQSYPWSILNFGCNLTNQPPKQVKLVDIKDTHTNVAINNNNKKKYYKMADSRSEARVMVFKKTIVLPYFCTQIHVGLNSILFQATVNVLKFRTPKLRNWHMQTVQPQIRLLLKE